MELISGMDINSHDNLEEAFNVLEEQFKAQIIVTLEEQGGAYRNNLGQVEVIPTIKVKPVDTTGAGDIFHGAFIYGLAQQWSLDKIIRFANVAGAMSVTKLGGRNSMFTLKEIEEVYNEIK